jgi:hypothetical protein
MISTFKANDEFDPLVQYLMGTRSNAPIEQLREKASAENAKNFLTYSFTRDCQILNPAQRDRLCEFMNFMWTNSADATTVGRVDMRLVVPDKPFVDILNTVEHMEESSTEPNGQVAVRKLQQAYANVPGSHRRTEAPKIALRQTRGPTNACINFHCDGGYATSTTQIALNEPSEYEGGRLIFFVNDVVHVLERPAGSMVQHPPEVLHGVSSLTSGTRQSLFVVDKANGLGEDGVITVTSEHVQSFVDSLRPRPADCVVCTTHMATHVLHPCGHMCLCSRCVTALQVCPKCRAPTENKIRVFF